MNTRGTEAFLVHFAVPLLAAAVAGWLCVLALGDPDSLIATGVAVCAFWVALIAMRRWWLRR